MPVIQVQPWGEGQGDYVLIEDFDFNPDFHKLLGEKSAGGDDAPKLTAAELKTKLAELKIEFKGNASRDALQALFDTHEAAALVADLKAKLTEKGVSFEEDATAEQLQALLDKPE
jgi:predicted HAD superfamily Cof-like phosphohydrolase